MTGLLTAVALGSFCVGAGLIILVTTAVRRGDWHDYLFGAMAFFGGLLTLVMALLSR
jgi:hypothetical protein